MPLRMVCLTRLWHGSFFRSLWRCIGLIQFIIMSSCFLWRFLIPARSQRANLCELGSTEPAADRGQPRIDLSDLSGGNSLKDDVAKRITTPKRIDRALCLIGLIGLMFDSRLAVAGPLDLDPTCNGTGKVVKGLQLDPQYPQDTGRDLAIQQDGKIVVVGDASAGRETFGEDGHVLTDFASTQDIPVGIAIQSDGKILVAGSVSDATGDSQKHDFALARYNQDGTLDQSFGTAGLVRIDFGAAESCSGVALQQDGKIVVAGQQQPVDTSTSDFLTARYLPNGELDSGFGNTGRVVTDFSGAWDIAWAVDIQGDGKIVVVGSSWDDSDFLPTYGALARYNANGSLDMSFDRGLGQLCVLAGSCGKFKVNLGLNYFDHPYSVALRRANGVEDGKILVTGPFGLARFEANGSRDTGFGTNGVVDNSENTGEGLRCSEPATSLSPGVVLTALQWLFSDRPENSVPARL